MAGQGLLGECPRSREDGAADGGADVGRGLLEVLAGVAGHHLEAPEGGDPRAGLGLRVEGGDLARQGLHHLDPDLPPREAALEGGFVGQAPHLHRPLDDLAVALHPHSPGVARHRHHPEVDLRGQAAVEAHLLLAVVPAFGQRAEVEEPEFDGLLDLVDEVAGQEDRRDVGLADLHLPDRVGVSGRVREGLDQLGQVHLSVLS